MRKLLNRWLVLAELGSLVKAWRLPRARRSAGGRCEASDGGLMSWLSWSSLVSQMSFDELDDFEAPWSHHCGRSWVFLSPWRWEVLRHLETGKKVHCVQRGQRWAIRCRQTHTHTHTSSIIKYIACKSVFVRYRVIITNITHTHDLISSLVR